MSPCLAFKAKHKLKIIQLVTKEKGETHCHALHPEKTKKNAND